MTNRFKKRMIFLLVNNLLHLFLFTTIISVISTSKTLSQIDTVKGTSDISPAEGNLNKLIQAVIKTGKLSNTVFKLEPNGSYILTDSILVPAGEHLTIVAPETGTVQATAPPQILWTSKNTTDRSYFFYCYGDLTLRNIWVLSADTKGNQVGACIIFRDNPLSTTHSCEFENVIIDYVPIPALLAGGAVTVACKNFNGKFINCYWKNCIDSFWRYYGRAVSFPFNSTGFHGNSVNFENCTFANIGYVLMQEGGEYHDYVKFNHCTFLNVVMYPLESGCWYKMSVTNSIFVNTFMFGDILAFIGNYDQNGGTIRIDSIKNFGFAVPYKEQERGILFSNNSYFIEKWLRDWMNNSPYAKYLKTYNQLDQIPCSQPMLSKGTLKFFESIDVSGKKEFLLMNKANLCDGVNPFLVYPPTDTTLIKSFIYRKWDNSSAENWAFLPEQSLQRIWPLNENIAYTNDTLVTAGMGGFPLGDLYRWFPEKYKQWKAQEDLENDRITTWLETGIDKYTSVRENNNKVIPSSFSLSQNYPNPFNPATAISYQLPASSHVMLKVYDILGREVVTLVNNYHQAGNYKVEFNAPKLVSGIYFYRLQAGDFVQTKKLILLK